MFLLGIMETYLPPGFGRGGFFLFLIFLLDGTRRDSSLRILQPSSTTSGRAVAGRPAKRLRFMPELLSMPPCTYDYARPS